MMLPCGRSQKKVDASASTGRSARIMKNKQGVDETQQAIHPNQIDIIHSAYSPAQKGSSYFKVA
jgi:citrate lyase beta subunit